MANNIDLAQNYLPLLDEVYKVSSRTSVLDATQIDIVGGNTVKIYKTSMDGLGDYSRKDGFVSGDVVGEWETLTLTKDRGRSFMVDAMDNEETIGQAFGTLAGEFVRTKVSPEIDAYTFAKLAGSTGILTGTAANITVGTTDVPALVDEAERAMNEAEVPTEGRILFISETAFAGLRNKVERVVMNDETGVDHEILSYDGMRIVRVPQSRFNTVIELAANGAGGYTASGKKINFMVVHPSAVTKVVKHVLPRIFTPAENQQADAWKFDYRLYFDVFAYENKANGIYLHTAV